MIIDGKEPEVNPGSEASLNTIFYGPPGTGKTYEALRLACELITGEELSEQQEVRKKLDESIKQGRAALVTFHQSYGYEEFVEGIRPQLGKGKELGYELRDGIFKKLAVAARNKWESFEAGKSTSNANIDIEELYALC